MTAGRRDCGTFPQSFALGAEGPERLLEFDGAVSDDSDAVSHARILPILVRRPVLLEVPSMYWLAFQVLGDSVIQAVLLLLQSVPAPA